MTSETSQQDTEEPRKSKPGLIDFLTTVPGIISALTALVTAAAAFYGGTQLSSGAPQAPAAMPTAAPARTVAESAAAAQGSQGQATPTSSDTSSAADTIYLSSLTPLQDEEPGLDSVINGSQQIGASTFPNSVRLTCFGVSDGSSIVYEVATYQTLEVTIGIPSDATNASGNSATIKFLKDGTSTQLAPQVGVALDKPQTVSVPLEGASQLDINCAGEGGNIDIALANATLSP